MSLAQHILDALGLVSPVDSESLANALQSIGVSAPEPLYSAEGKMEVLREFGQVEKSHFAIVRANSLIDTWNYHTIQIASAPVAEVLEIPASENRGNPPTNGERLLVRLWNADLTEYEKAIQGRYVIAAWNENGQIEPQVREALLSLFEVVGPGSPELKRPAWRDGTSIVLSESSALLSAATQYARLSELAFGERSIRWRFLGLYRILEHGLLELIFDRLKRDFSSAPHDTVEWARVALKSELSKLTEFVKECRLESSFESFQTIADSIRKSNYFTAALHRQWEHDPDRKRLERSWGKGVFLCYKTRCAIVHAGDGFLIYEKYKDADEAVAQFLVPLEEAVFAYLGLVIS